MDIIDIHTGADDPAPWFKALDIRHLRGYLFRVVLPLPQVVDIPCSLLLHLLDEFNKKVFAVCILEIGKVLALQITAVRVHDQPRNHVVDPEVIFFLRSIAKVTNTQDRPLLSLCSWTIHRRVPVHGRFQSSSRSFPSIPESFPSFVPESFPPAVAGERKR